MEFGNDFIYNFLAPENHRMGERYYGALYHNYEDFMEFKFTLEYFGNESDTSVAFFNSELYGHNDRYGFLVNLQSHLYSSGITLGFSYVRSWPINPSVKKEEHTYIFSVKTNYMPI